RGHGRDRPSDVMAASCLCFGLSAVSFAAASHLPFMLAATLVVAGALGGILLAYLAIRLALGGPPLSWKPFVVFFGAAVLGQAGLAAWAGDVVPLMFSTSVINSVTGGVIAILLWRRMRGIGGGLALFLVLPFAGFAAAYALRLLIFAADPGAKSYVLGTAIIVLVTAGSALNWVFGLTALREAQARRALEVARRRLEADSRAKSDFLRSLSHELRTPLNAVVGFAELMRRQSMGPLPDRYHEAAEHIHIAGRHLNDLIEDLLDLSVIEAGRLKLDESELPANEVLSAALAIVQDTALEKNIRLERQDMAQGAVVRVDRRRMVQALVNLLVNAAKYSPKGSSVTAGTTLSENGGLAFFVNDDGPGMTTDELAEAMTLFGRLRRRGEPHNNGIGVGLPLARELAEAHGGTLSIESAPQAGTLARIELPAERLLGARRGTDLPSLSPGQSHLKAPEAS
ncbi:MAG: HAMP domain-containing sensor histidine kinase, partial [Pseudomonadota bacterium]